MVASKIHHSNNQTLFKYIIKHHDRRNAKRGKKLKCSELECVTKNTSLRTVSPSLTILGGPYLFCKTTFLPFGPKVTPTSSATKSTPACNNHTCSHKHKTVKRKKLKRRKEKEAGVYLKCHLKFLCSRTIVVEVNLFNHSSGDWIRRPFGQCWVFERNCEDWSW